MRVLFCTDGSKISYDAVKNFAQWVNTAIVDIICVIDWSFLPEDVNIEEGNFTQSCANIADHILEYSGELINKTGLTAGELIKHCGSTVESILEELHCRDYDLVVMGSHGKKGIQRWLGSVSKEVIASSNVSAYISRKENLSQRVLFTVDGSEDAKKAAEFAADNFNLENKSIYICMVNEDPDLLFLEGTLDAHWLIEIERQQQAYSVKTTKEIQDIFESKGLQVLGTDILTGNPAQEIINLAEKINIDLVVTGSANKKKNFLSNSVSKRVLENSKSDVLIIK